MILMMNQKITNAVKAINPNAEFIIRATSADAATIDGIEWEDGTTPIAKSDIETKMVEIQTAYDAQEYARDRATEYPSTGDQLDMLWHAIDTGDWTAAKVKLTSFYTELKAVKDKYPKE